MLYCSDKRNLEGNIVKKIIPRNKRIYYDEESDLFYNQYNQIIRVKDRVVVPLSNGEEIGKFYSLLKNKGVLFTNKLEDIEKIEKWYEYIEPYRQVVPFSKAYLKDLSFLTYIIELFGSNAEVYLSDNTQTRVIDLDHLINGRNLSSILNDDNDEFLLSEKIDINEDEYGKIEYQALIERGKIISVSRLINTEEYIKIPFEVHRAINEFLQSLPKEFPRTFVIRIASTKNIYELIDIRPLEKIDNVPTKNIKEYKGYGLSKISK